MLAYASRTGTKRNLRMLQAKGWRLLVSATGVHRSEGFHHYALDNGAWTAFQRGAAFDGSLFMKLLGLLGQGADWAVLPDIVCGGEDSLRLSVSWLDRVLEICQMALIPVQNGMTTDMVEPIIGGRIGVFVGGDTEWKLATMARWCQIAKKKGAWCHVGRVNSAKRISRCLEAGADSFDGSSASRYAVNIIRLDNSRRQGAFQWGDL